MCSKLINLVFVQMGNWLHVGGAVAVLDEEPLVVFQPVRCAGHGIVQAVGVVIFDLLAGPLLHVRRRDDRQIGF